MKTTKIFTLIILAIILTNACNSGKKQQGQSIEAPTQQEIEEFADTIGKRASSVYIKLQNFFLHQIKLFSIPGMIR